MKRAAFIVSDCGLGHKVRCGALADELRARGWDWIVLSRGEAWAGDVLVIDHPDPGPVKVGVSRVVRVVDVPIAETADLLIQGWELVRPEFRRWKWAGFPDSQHFPGWSLCDLRDVSSLSSKALAYWMSAASIAITYAGMRASECACVGVPMVVIPRNEGERLNTARLVHAGAAVVAEEDEAESMARSLLESPAALRAMSHAGRELVDGLGVKRAADAIEGLFA